MITKQESIGLFRGMPSLGNLTGAKFTYAIIKNFNYLKPEIEALEKVIKPTDEFTKFDKERIVLAEKFSKKDKEGNAEKIELRNEKGEVFKSDFDIEDMDAFEKAFEKLKKENKEVVISREKQVEEYDELLKTPSTVELYKIKLEDVPEGVSVSQMSLIEKIIE